MTTQNCIDTTITVATDRSVLRPLQPLFVTTVDAANNITGDGTVYTCAVTERIDQGGNFAGTTFTVPTSGNYAFTADIDWSGAAAAHTNGAAWFLVNGATQEIFAQDNPANTRTVGNTGSYCGCLTFDLDAADTVVLQISMQNGALVVDIASGNFGGYLIC
jgi:hypothetical protein